MKFHYAQAVPVSTIGYNVYNDNDEWCGVILYGHGVNKCLGKDYGLPQGGALELVRVALNGKQECTTKALAMSMKQLKKDCPLCRLIVSYADCDQDHLGTIYQATNWVYVGEFTKGESHAFIIDGKKIHEISVKKKTIKMYGNSRLENIKKVYKTDNIVPFITKGKRKYLFALDKKMRKQIAKLAKPYPKRDANWEKIDRNMFRQKEATPEEVANLERQD